MKTLNVSISELEIDKFGIKKGKISFSEFLDLVSKELTRQNLEKTIALAQKYGFSKMNMDEITKEVKAARKNAKNHN